MDCYNKFAEKNSIELLVNPITRKFAIRTTTVKNRQSVVCSRKERSRYKPRDITITAFYETLYSMFGWNMDYKYRVTGTLYEEDNEIAYIFDTANTEAFLKPQLIPKDLDDLDGISTRVQPLTPYRKRVRAIPESWTNNFGKQYYLHEKTYAELETQSETDWKLRLEGQLVETGKKLNVTSFEELREYIKQELKDIKLQEESIYESI